MPDERVSKASVAYGPGKPEGDHCAVCRHFRKPQSCEVVAGRIDPEAWCKHFQSLKPRPYR